HPEERARRRENPCNFARSRAFGGSPPGRRTAISADGQICRGWWITVRGFDLRNAHGQESRHRRIACEGENAGEIPRSELHGEGLGRSRGGPPEVEARGRHRERLQA